MSDPETPTAQSPSAKSVAVAVVALTRFVAARDPSLGGYLNGVLKDAVRSGLSPADLDLLRMLVRSLGVS